jgi:hypothetical protein
LLFYLTAKQHRLHTISVLRINRKVAFHSINVTKRRFLSDELIFQIR